MAQQMIQFLFLKQNYPAIRIICFDKNYGFAKGYNEALKQVEADYYVLLEFRCRSADTVGWNRWLSLLESDKSIAACQPKILSYNNKKHI